MTATLEYHLPGLHVRERVVPVPLDWGDAGGPAIDVFVRDLVDPDKRDDDLPLLVYLQGGPGGANPRPVDRSGWIAVRASGPGANGWMSGSSGIVAHANPVWLEVKGRAMDARADAEYFLSWIDRLEADLVKRDRLPTGGSEHVARRFLVAREICRRIAEGTYDYKFSRAAQ
mgnify:CR=1 FL=1